MKKLSGLAILAISGLLSSCGGGGSSAPVLAVTADTSVANNAASTGAVAQIPFSFASGVPSFGTTGTTTVQFTSATASPGFAIESGGATATGATTFGSCVFAVTASSFPAGNALALGQTVTVNPCNLSVGTAGAVANGVGTTRSVALVLGAASSAGASVTVGVNAGGQLTLNGNIVATVTLTPVSGAGG